MRISYGAVREPPKIRALLEAPLQQSRLTARFCNHFQDIAVSMRTKSFTDRRLLIGAGTGLLCLHVWLAWISSEFQPEIPLLDRPVATLVILELAAGALFLAAARVVRSLANTGGMFAWLIVVGALMRVTMAASTPMLENDFYRYLWDGAVLAHGVNPFRYSPEQVTDAPDSVPPVLRGLAQESGKVIHRIDHENLRTIYPPVSQVIFAVSYVLRPWSLTAWRLVLSVFDVATLLLLLFALRSLKLSPLLMLIYWWNPLVVKEIANSAHMDVIVLPMVIFSVMLAARGRHVWASVPLIFAVGAKVWPVVLLPQVLWPLRSNIVRLVSVAACFIISCGLLFVPVFMAGIDSSSGFTAYSTRWEMNDALYMAISWATHSLLGILGESSAWWAQLVPRVLTFLVLCGWIAWLLRHEPRNPLEWWDHSLLVVAAVLLLSPAQFPWYYLWVIPFLVIRPRPSLLLLSALLPLYYLRFYFKARHTAWIFDDYIVWLEYLPVWALLLREWVVSRRKWPGNQNYRRDYPSVLKTF